MLVRYADWQTPFYAYGIKLYDILIVYFWIMYVYCSIFHHLGIVGILWFFLWMTQTADRPSVHPTISDKEKVFIESSIGSVWNNSIIRVKNYCKERN